MLSSRDAVTRAGAFCRSDVVYLTTPFRPRFNLSQLPTASEQSTIETVTMRYQLRPQRPAVAEGPSGSALITSKKRGLEIATDANSSNKKTRKGKGKVAICEPLVGSATKSGQDTKSKKVLCWRCEVLKLPVSSEFRDTQETLLMLF